MMMMQQQLPHEHKQTETDSVMISRLDALLNRNNLNDDDDEDDVYVNSSSQVQRDSGNDSDYTSSGGGPDDKTNLNQLKSGDGVGGGGDGRGFAGANGKSGVFLENGVEYMRVREDVSMPSDERTLANLLYLQEFYRVQTNYFRCTQTEIRPWMHKTLASWMLEVCKNQSPNSYDEIFTLSMNLLDRFLSVQPVAKQHLQLIGTVCMFIASKLKSSTTPQQFAAETLVIYTDKSITVEDLLVCEQLVMQRLHWDVQAVLAVDLLPHLIAELGLVDEKNDHEEDELDAETRSYLSSLVCMCATHFRFALVSASMIAAACLYLALRRRQQQRRSHSNSIELEHIHSVFSSTTVDFERLVLCVEMIDKLAQVELPTHTNQSEDEAQTDQHKQQQHINVEISSC